MDAVCIKSHLTALMLATIEGQVDVVFMLLSAGARVSTRDYDGNTALHLTGIHGDPVAVRALVEAGADVCSRNRVDYTPLMNAVTLGRKEAAEELLRCGADIDAQERRSGNTPLMIAVSWQEREIVEALVGSGADVARRNMNGKTALHFAAAAGDKRVIILLTRAGAKVASETFFGEGKQTPLHFASMCRKPAALVGLVKALERQSECLPRQNKNVGANTMFCPPASPTTPECHYLRVLNCSDREGASALQYAVENCDVKSATVLLRAGAFLRVASNVKPRSCHHINTALPTDKEEAMDRLMARATAFTAMSWLWPVAFSPSSAQCTGFRGSVRRVRVCLPLCGRKHTAIVTKALFR